MSTRLRSFDFEAAKCHRQSPYPWSQWTDGGIWQATRGTDFECLTYCFAQQVYAKAWRLGRGVRIHRDGDTVVFQFFDKEAAATSGNEKPAVLKLKRKAN